MGRLRSIEYKTFMTATAISALGDGLLVTGLPLLARATTANPVTVAAVFAAGRAPWIFALFFGAATDRRDAKTIMISADVVRGIVLGAIGVFLVATNRPIPVWALLLLAATLSVGSIMYFAGSQRALPSIVADADLEAANGTLTAITSGGEQFIGPPLGAVFLAGGKIPVLGDAFSFLGSAAMLTRLKPIPPAKSTRSTVLQDGAAGLAWFRTSALIKMVTLQTGFVAFVSGGILATEVILIRDTLKLSNWWFGVFTAVMAVGSIVGSMIASRFIAAVGNSSYSICHLVCGLCYLACVGARSPVVVFTAMFFQQLATMIGVVTTLSLRQRAIPPDLRGRVLTLTKSIAYSLSFAGAFLGGWITKVSGTDAAFASAGIVIVVVTTVGARPILRLLAAERQIVAS